MTAPVIAPEIGEPTVVQVRAMKVPVTLLVLAGLLGILFLLAPATASPRIDSPKPGRRSLWAT
jgi:hypothetical protein